MIGRKPQPLISEEKSLAESTQKYQCLYDKSYADYKSKVFAENAWGAVDKKMGFEEGKKFFYFLCIMKLKRRTYKIFYKCFSFIRSQESPYKQKQTLTKTYRSTKPLKFLI